MAEKHVFHGRPTADAAIRPARLSAIPARAVTAAAVSDAGGWPRASDGSSRSATTSARVRKARVSLPGVAAAVVAVTAFHAFEEGSEFLAVHVAELDEAAGADAERE